MMINFNFYKPELHVKIGFFLVILFIACYTLPNQLEWLPATPVALVSIDHIIPFQVEWIWFYLITYPYVAIVYFFGLNEEGAKIFVNSYILASAVGAIIFFSYPTIIVRNLYAVNPERSISSLALYYFHFLDKPKNCIPSFHIALTFITSASLYLSCKRKGVLGIILGLLIAYSTMAVKQHYFLDVLSGFILGSASFSWLYFSLRKKESSSLGVKPVN